MPGGGCALPGLQPQITAGAGAAETAGAGGLNIAETFPEGRGSPHGCGLRAVFCRDAASARPEACRDKSKAPRSGDVAGRSPGYRGGGDWPPPCAPGAISDIAQKTYRERNLPEIALDGSPAKRSAGRDISGCADISPGGGWRLTRPTGLIRPGTTEPTGL